MMQGAKTYILKYSILICALAILSSCNNAQHKTRQATRTHVSEETAQGLLQANEDIIPPQNDKVAQALDPWEAHLRARRQVNPNETSKRRRYTTKKKPGAPAENQRTRSADAANIKLEQLQSALNAPIPLHKPVALVHVTEEVAPPQTTEVIAAKTPPPASKKPKFKPSYGLKADNLPDIAPAAGNQEPSKIVSGLSHIKNIRIGDHPGKTRIVVDLTEPVAFSYIMDGDTLHVKFKKAKWDAQSLRQYKSHPLLIGYKAETTQQEAHLTFALKKSAKVISKQRYAPNATYQHNRVVIDIAAL